MKPNEIKQAIYEKGYDLTMIAEVLGKSPSLVSKVLHNKARSFLVAKGIAQILGQDIRQVFPNQYDKLRGRTSKASESYKAKQKELRKLLNQE
ncbi:MAG: helix-turn-helix domain-containing protein [Idiomarina sp.]|nr:helix-turn-helix domain-containing protein [Idiomarina sp.]